MATGSSTVKTIVIKVEGGQAIASMDNVTLSTKELNSELVKLSKNAGKGKGGGGASGATGGATATVMELGRAISDSNYGIRGMANNVSQLASNFLFMTRKVDETTQKAIGFGGALRQVGSTILGPLGILLAIQGVIALLEKFEINSMKAKSASNEFNSSLTDEITTLKIYDEALLDVNTSLEERVGIIKGLSRLDKDLADKLKEAGTDTEKLTKINKDFLKQKELELEIGLKKMELDEVFDKRLELRIEQAETQAKIDKMTADDFITKNGDRVQILNNLEDTTNNLDDATKKYNKTSEEYFLLLAKTNKEEEKTKGSRARSVKSFKQRLLDFSKEILKFNRDDELATEENEFKKLEIKQKYEREDLQNKHDSFMEKERLRLENFLNTTKDEAKIAEAKALFNETKLQAEKEHQDALTELTITQASKRFNFQLEIARESTRKYQEAVDAGEIRALTFGMTQDAGVDALNAEGILLQAQYDQKVYWLDEEIKDRIRDKESYMDLLKQKLNAEKEFNNDKLVLTEKTEEAKLDIVQYGFEVIGSIAEKGSAIGKAAAVAATLMSTRKAAVAALGAEPYGPWNIAQAALVTAMGLSNVNKILNTPTPKRDGGTTTSAGASGAGDRTFDFNLVGSTGTNQLAQAVGSQFQEPVQAYVVSSQMTSQQELDLQISTGASLGGD
jgi:hypothetical protein